jgi:type II secretory pathway pseudopilin PulG
MRAGRIHLHSASVAGYTLIEALVGLVVVVAIIAIFASSFSGLGLRTITSHEVIAADLARQEIESLRRLNPNRLTNRTDASFIGVLFNLGRPSVIADSSASHSLPNVLELVAGSGTTASVRAVIPTNELSDADWSTKVFIRSTSAAGWRVGFTLRQSDDENAYRVRLASSSTDLDSSAGGTQNAIFEKIVTGTTTKLASALVALNTGSWSTVSFNATGTTMIFQLNSSQIFSVTDSSLAKGSLAVEGASGVHALIDDVAVATTSESWNFDADPVGPLPGEWTTATLEALPNASGLLTISDVAGVSNLKHVNVRVQWSDPNKTRSVQLVTYMRGS